MTKTFCDRCETDISVVGAIRLLEGSWKYDLCFRCFDSFKKWITQNKQDTTNG